MKKSLFISMALFFTFFPAISFADVPTRPEITGTFSVSGGGSTDMQTYSGGGTASVGVMSLDEMQTGTNSVGITRKGASLGFVTLNGTTAVDVAAGSCLIRPTDDKSDDLEYLEWSSVTNHELSGATAGVDIYVYVDYSNGATVQYAEAPNPNSEFDQTVCPLAEVHRTGTTITDVHDMREFVGNHAQEFSIFHAEIFGVLATGNAATESGTRNLAITSGTFYKPGYNNPDTVTFDSSTSIQNFTYWYGDGGGGFVNFTSSQLDNSQYDNAGTLTAITGGSWKKDFIRRSESGKVHVVYGVAEYATEQLAIDAASPPLPSELQPDDHVRPIATWRIEELTASGTMQDDANRFTGGGSASLGDHGAATGLLDPDHPQYVLTTAFATYTSTATSTASKILQVVSVFDGIVATGTTTIPLDNSVPQITEGDQYMSLSITPLNAGSILIITSKATLSSATVGTVIVTASLFRDSTADSIGTTDETFGGNNRAAGFTVNASVPANSTSTTTIKFRAGSHIAGTTSFNGPLGIQRYGGTYDSNITIWEVGP